MGSNGTEKTRHQNIAGYLGLYKASKSTLDDFGIDITNHVSTPINSEVMENADIVFVMDKLVFSEHENSLSKQFPEHRHKIHLFSELDGNEENIIDPDKTENPKEHKRVIERICYGLDKNFDKLIGWCEK